MVYLNMHMEFIETIGWHSGPLKANFVFFFFILFYVYVSDG